MFTVKPANIIVSYGQNLLLACEVSGKPTPSISWSKSDGQLQQQSVALPAGLQLYSVASSDAGTYTCRATNTVGTNTTDAVVTVTS